MNVKCPLCKWGPWTWASRASWWIHLCIFWISSSNSPLNTKLQQPAPSPHRQSFHAWLLNSLNSCLLGFCPSSGLSHVIQCFTGHRCNLYNVNFRHQTPHPLSQLANRATKKLTGIIPQYPDSQPTLERRMFWRDSWVRFLCNRIIINKIYRKLQSFCSNFMSAVPLAWIKNNRDNSFS